MFGPVPNYVHNIETFSLNYNKYKESMKGLIVFRRLYYIDHNSNDNTWSTSWWIYKRHIMVINSLGACVGTWHRFEYRFRILFLIDFI